MWLLSTDRAELRYFARHSDAEGGYAILSHTWDGNEQSFRQVRAIVEQCHRDGTNPRDFVDAKIRECCILAEKHGYHWVWIDSCCIDKTSSSELSEAINSMYKWYKSSEVCYAYLKDVPSDDILESPNSAFWNSRWHTRGWTLQELIAPDSVIFLSDNWRELGNRAELALLLHRITRIPVSLMLGVTRPAQYFACMRMSWASHRKTTKIEDEAYCLMGLFGVSMATNYGEGRRAFIRLQYEIMQHQECDMSLFAFGEQIMANTILCDGITFGSNLGVDRDNAWWYLLADSPRQFSNSFSYIPALDSDELQTYPPSDSENSQTTRLFGDIELPHATVTSYGVQFRLPVATVDGITLAVILCRADKQNIGLFLTRDDRAKDPKRPRYLVGCSYTRSKTGSSRYLARMCDLGDDIYKLTFNGKRVKASWRTIYIVPTASNLDSESVTSPNLLINCHPGSRFRLPRWLVDRLIGLHFEVEEVEHNDTLRIISFIHRSQGRILMCLGTCKHHRGPDKPPLWANMLVTTRVDPEEDFPHDCSEDHLDSESWAMRSRSFGDAERMVRLSFTQLTGRTSPEALVTIHLELSGTIFNRLMLREAGISFPSLTPPERESPCPIPDTLLTTSWHLRHPWPRVGAFDNDGDCPCYARKATSSRLFLKDNMRHPEPIPNASISDTTSSRPLTPSPERKPGTLELSSSRWAFMTLLLTPLAQILRLFSIRSLNALSAEGGSGPARSANTLM